MHAVIDNAKRFKLLSDPTRLAIIKLLIEFPEGLCVNEISETLGISHSAASHQLTRLENRGILTCERIGQMVCYKMRRQKDTRVYFKLAKLNLI